MRLFEGLTKEEIEELKKGFYKVLGEELEDVDKYISQTVVKGKTHVVSAELMRFTEVENVSQQVENFIHFLLKPEIIKHVKIVRDRSYFNFSAMIGVRTMDLSGHRLSAEGLGNYDREGYVQRAIELGLDFYVYLKGSKEHAQDREMARMDFERFI